MVMGYNTDVSFNGRVFHIQTEPRKDARIETTVYYGGAIVHSLKTSYLELLSSPDYSEESLRRLLEDQHRQVITQIRDGKIDPPDLPAATT